MKPKLKLVENIASSTAPQKIVIQKGVVIKKRERSDAWQIYITVKGKKPIRKSANTDNVEKAKQMALTLFAEKNYKVENNLPIQKHLFADVANKYIAYLDRLVSNGAKKEATATFAKTTISNYFVPYFGKTSVEAINRVAIADFQKWRIENSVKFEDGVRCKPSTATLNKEETELNKMLEFALDKGYISQKPSIKKTKVKSNRHPHFTKPEFRKLLRKLRMFIEASPNGSIRQQRVLMYSAIVILAGTGLRPHELLPDAEKASKGLKWKDVRIVDNDEKVGKKYVKIHIHKLNSKTGKARDVYAGGSVHWHFRRLREKLDTRWVEIQKVFNSDFRRSFKSFLTWANMRTNAEGENYCMYSFRHSYATWKIEEGKSIQQLAEVMGNSPNIIHKHYSHAMTANFKENFI
tara:strand:- start:5746 stop:6966 length:1221 start_codon:yes stop_codon:yes gene_type:complete